MAKITKLEEKTYQGKHTGWKVSVDNGPLENMNEKESSPNLREGDNVTVTIEDYIAKSTGKHSNLLTLKLAPPEGTLPIPQRPTINVGAGKSREEMKADASTQIMLKLLDAVYNGKIDSAKVAVELKEWDILLWAEIDECYSK
jgi:hypothetical protein